MEKLYKRKLWAVEVRDRLDRIWQVALIDGQLMVYVKRKFATEALERCLLPKEARKMFGIQYRIQPFSGAVVRTAWRS